jgi:two-component system aerobic respiration control sensor histidine kinase ArcB
MSNDKFKILLVEDVKMAQKIAIMVLESLNCEVDIADDGNTALKKASCNHFDLIFMDLGLPDMDGLTVTEMIRKMEQDKKNPTIIIALTAHNDDKIRELATSVGMNDFLLKPLTTEAAEEIFNKYLLKTG